MHMPAASARTNERAGKAGVSRAAVLASHLKHANDLYVLDLALGLEEGEDGP